ncbi:hypothetical protein H8K35_11200 [Undibacterium sp. LX40W]|uniref:Uncharacterized protein n=1 Tax=Undibacterium nitidum TaxID=2762298 RepID=A0A923KTN0_9BURK|nr:MULTISPECIES: hypothetical protein [Undibacterium]MBC3881774.1 hypothetical protein [Undibacterium nitidum]MBC3892229.1 hypothetical protein [Undibacterium sp. LX40W]
MNWLNGMLSIILLVLTGWSMRRYVHSLDRALVLSATLCLLAILWQEQWEPWIQKQLPQSASTTLILDSDKVSEVTPNLLLQIEHAQQIQLKGEGYRQSQWHDIPAKRLQWQVPTNKPALQLDSDPRVALGREFELRIKRETASMKPTGTWRAQLLAENGVLLVEEKSRESSVSLRWLAPVAERMVLQAKVFDENDQLIDSGPIPVEVKALDALQVWGRFDASSFDARSLQNLLRQSQAVLDWQTRLGKDIQHIEAPIADVTKMDLMITDAAFLEQQSGASLQKILAQVAQGKTLIVLGANANQTSFWNQRFELALQAVNQTKDAEVVVDVSGFGSMSLSPNAFAVTPSAASKRAMWQAYPQTKGSSAWLWQRSWLRGRIAWIAVSDWHRHAIATPQKLTAWWQQVLDQVHQSEDEQVRWALHEKMPIAGERQVVCVQGVSQGTVATAETEKLALKIYDGAIDQLCAAWRPSQAGWQDFSLSAPELKEAKHNAFYVYPNEAWPSWQRQLKVQATRTFAQRLPANAASTMPQVPLWPLYLLTALLLLALWRRDTRRT